LIDSVLANNGNPAGGGKERLPVRGRVGGRSALLLCAGQRPITVSQTSNRSFCS
jgi:hypothetical protein